MKIPFNQPYLSGKELEYIEDAVKSRWISGNGKYTKLCHQFFQTKYGFQKCLLTTSCTDALEMAAILIDIQPGDEVIMPSYTFVSTANAFVLRGAKIVFADSRTDHPGLDEDSIENLITKKTKAIVPVYYAGVSCDMDKIMDLAAKYNIYVIEDAAQAIDSYYIGKDGIKKPLGSIGHLSAFSFHETKNIISGEGGMLVINDEKFAKRAEIIWEKGTNRSSFFRGEVDKYNWVDFGSSFLPSEIIAAFLYAQLENIKDIQTKRKLLWDAYYNGLSELNKNGLLSLPIKSNEGNAHLFYIVTKNNDERNRLLDFLKEHKIHAVFHYLSLHNSPYSSNKYENKILINCEKYSDCLIRLPLFYELKIEEIKYITDIINKFYG